MAVPQWLDRDLVQGPYLCLCTSEEQFRAAMDHMKIPQTLQPHKWLQASACVWAFTQEDSDNLKGLTCVVCMDSKEAAEQDPISVCGLLCHEAVHIFQDWCEHFGEKSPSKEFEAYSVQNIAQRLMWAYKEQLT